MTKAESQEIVAFIRSLVKLKRHGNKVTLRQMCKQCDISIPTISRFENGRNLDADTFLRFVDWLKP